MTSVLASIDAFDVWLDRCRLCWKVAICAEIVCVGAALMFAICELLRTGVVPVRLVTYMSFAAPTVLVIAFIVGLATERIEKRRQEAAR